MIFKIFDYIKEIKILPLLLVLCALIISVINYCLFVSCFSQPLDNSLNFILLISINILTIIILFCYIIYQLYSFFQFYHNNKFVFQFKLKIISIISVISVVSILFFIIFTFSFFNLNHKLWVNNTLEQSFDASLDVSQLYIEDSKNNIINDITHMRELVEKKIKLLVTQPLEFDQKFLYDAKILSLSEAVMFFYNDKMKIISQTSFNFLPKAQNLDMTQYSNIDMNAQVIFNKENSYIRALIKLDNLPNSYLLVGRYMSNEILRNIKDINIESNHYLTLQEQVRDIRQKFHSLFILTILLILCSVFILTIYYSTKFFLPILDLILATRRISSGNYNVILGKKDHTEEVSVLLKSFNRMSKSLQRRHNELNLLLHKSNQESGFLKSVIGSLPVSLLIIDLSLKIKLFNKATKLLLEKNNQDLQDINISNIITDINILIDRLHNSNMEYISDKIIITNDKGEKKKLSILLSIENSGKEINGYVIMLSEE
jgi:two-component system nitrogen regulation sensor histidine kinase NtrY